MPATEVVDPALAAARLAALVREAGALALSMFKTPLNNWTKGTASSPVCDADIADGFYVTDLIGMGVNLVTGDYSRGASGFWIENGQATYPVSEVTIAGHLSEMFKSLTPANDLKFRYGTDAPTVRVEGLTVAGH